MSKIIKTEVFFFNELSDKAKEKARDWMRDCQDEYEFESTVEYIKEMCEMLGIQCDKVYWENLNYQGESVGIEGSFSYNPHMLADIKANTPSLVSVAEAFCIAYKHSFYSATGSVNCIGRYLQSSLSSFDSNRGDPASLFDLFDDAFKMLDAWILKTIKDESDYINSNEYLDNMIKANEYTFTIDGKRFG